MGKLDSGTEEGHLDIRDEFSVSFHLDGRRVPQSLGEHDSRRQLSHAAAHRPVACAAPDRRARRSTQSPAPRASGGRDDLRLVPLVDVCEIFTRRNCQILDLP